MPSNVGPADERDRAAVRYFATYATSVRHPEWAIAEGCRRELHKLGFVISLRSFRNARPTADDAPRSGCGGRG